jgi:hypothetical protein
MPHINVQPPYTSCVSWYPHKEQTDSEMHEPLTPHNKFCAHVLYSPQALLAHVEPEQGHKLVLVRFVVIPLMHLNLIWRTVQRA